MSKLGSDKLGVYFGVWDFTVPIEEISKALDLEPTQAWYKGDSGPKGSIRTSTKWEFRGELFGAAGLEEQLDEIVAVLEARRGSLNKVKSLGDTGLHCYAYFYEIFNPELSVSAAVISRIGALELSLDLDLYFLGAVPSESA